MSEYELGDGFVVTKTKRHNRFSMIDGRLRLVDGDFDRSVLNDPESAPRSKVAIPSVIAASV